MVLYPGHTADQPDERPHARVGQLGAAQTQARHLVMEIFLLYIQHSLGRMLQVLAHQVNIHFLLLYHIQHRFYLCNQK